MNTYKLSIYAWNLKFIGNDNAIAENLYIITLL